MASKIAVELATALISSLATGDSKNVKELTEEVKNLKKEIKTQEAVIQQLENKNSKETERQNAAIQNLEFKNALGSEIMLKLLMEEKIKNSITSGLQDKAVQEQQPHSDQSKRDFHISVNTPGAKISIQQESRSKASKKNVPQNMKDCDSHLSRVDNAVRVKDKLRGNKFQKNCQEKDCEKSKTYYRRERTPHRVQSNDVPSPDNHVHCQKESYPKDFANHAVHHRRERTPHRVQSTYDPSPDNYGQCQKQSYPNDFAKCPLKNKKKLNPQNGVKVTVNTPNSQVKIQDNASPMQSVRKKSEKNTCSCDDCRGHKFVTKKPRYFSLLVVGFPETPNENAKDLFELICSEILGIKGVKVANACRSGNQNPRPIAVDLLDFKIGHEILITSKEKLIKGNLRIISNKPKV